MRESGDEAQPAVETYIGHLLMLAQAGYLSREEMVDSMTLFATTVAPRLANRYWQSQ